MVVGREGEGPGRGVVRHGVYRFHEQRGVDESLIWGDYYFLEAVDKAMNAA